jgi:hypothetical protein
MIHTKLLRQPSLLVDPVIAEADCDLRTVAINTQTLAPRSTIRDRESATYIHSSSGNPKKLLLVVLGAFVRLYVVKP